MLKQTPRQFLLPLAILSFLLPAAGVTGSAYGQPPRVQLPEIQAPQALAPRVQAPQGQAPQVQAPQVQAPQAQPSQGQVLHGHVPRGQEPPQPNSVIYKVTELSGRMEMTVNTSRRLVMDQKIPEAQVNDPSILQLTPLAPNSVQVSAEKPGVTQVNLWGEDKRIYTIDVVVHADARELQLTLQTQFPNASLKVVPVGTSVLISGYVDHPGHVGLIIKIAEQYYPNPINNMTVSGVQQVLLHVKVMEVSRTRLRRLGFDFAQISSGNLSNMVRSGVSGLIGGIDPDKGVLLVSDTDTFRYGLLDGGGFFLGMLEALRQDNLLKILAEPTLVTVSGRPAFFNVGGEIPVIVPQSLGTSSIEYKKIGTQLHFVPVVLGNGRVRLEVWPRVSEKDPANSIVLGGITVPGLRTREAETGVEMQFGQTLAIAGLVQNRIESENRGLPWVSDVPYLGTLFRRVEERNNEIELLIMVTPELAEAMDANEVPPCGPGMMTTSPSDCELYFKGHLEVPNCCPPGAGAACPQGIPGHPQNMGPTPVMPPGGMILDEGEAIIHSPQQTGASSSAMRPRPAVRNQPTVQSRPRPGPTASHNRYTSSRPQPRQADSRSGRRNPEPGFIGPIGYDVVE